MNLVLYALVPLPNSIPSPWKAGPGCSWRLCANRSRPNVIALSLFVVRHQTDSSAYIIVNAEYPDIASRPVSNMHVARRLPKHPRDVRLHLPSGEPSTEIHLPLTYAPPGEKEIALKINIVLEEQPSSPTAVRDISFPNPNSYDSECPRSCQPKLPKYFAHTRFQLMKSHIRTPLQKPSFISWIDEMRYSSATNRAPKGPFSFVEDYSYKKLSEYVEREPFISCNTGIGEAQAQPLCELKSPRCGNGRHPRKQSQKLNNFSDVTMVVQRDGDDDVEFYLDRCVLAMASPVFRAMFTCKMREGLMGRVELSAFDVLTVSIAVRHMYGEKIDDSIHQNPFGVYRFGHLFEMLSLLGISQKALITRMSNSTCIDVLHFGIFFNDDKLKYHAKNYILEHFSGIASVKETRQKLYTLPSEHFLALIESDMLVATELEIFLVSMTWLSHHEGSTSLKDVLRRIRWPLMTPYMLRTAINSPMITRYPALRNFLKTSRTTLSQHLNGTIHGRRLIFGHPMVMILIPAVRQPPAALLCVPAVDSHKHGLQSMRGNPQKLSLSSGDEKIFEYESLMWGFRAELSKCKSIGCCHHRLSASLWLEQDDAGCISSALEREGHGSHLLPVKVRARCMVWNSLGGQLHHRVIDFTFQSAGWAGGWCVEDVLGGHDQTEAFFNRLSSIREVGSVVQVAIEILKCEKG